MKVLRCSMCKNTIDISYDSETLKCPTCGKVYKNPLYKQNAVAPQNDEKPENQAPQEKTEQKPAPASNNEQSEIELLKARLAEMEKKQAANEQKIQTSQPKSTGKAVAYLKKNWKWMLVACLVLTTAITLLVCFVGIRGVYYNVDNPNEFYSFSPTKYEGHSVLEFSGDEIVETGKWKIRGNQMIFSMGSELFGEISVSSYFSKIDNKHFYLGEDKDNCSEFKRVSLKQYKSLRNKKINVTFDVNGGSGNNTTITVNTGYKTDAEIETPKREGCSFRGWYTDPWGYTNEKSLRFDKNNRIWESCTYYANWYNPTIYSITIKDKGASFTAHEGDLLLPIISGNGKFEGKCYLDGILIDENTRMPAKNVTITVELTKTQPIKFTLDAKGGQLSGVNEISVNYFESIDKINAFPIPTHPDGLIFVGWFYENNSDAIQIVSANGKFLPSLWSIVKGDVTLTAKYCDLSDFEYSIDDNGQIKITKYVGNSTSVAIPDSVTSIGDRAFYNCSGLTSITIPDSVTNIGEWAFSGCSGLTAVHITDLAAWCNISFGSSSANPLYYAKNLYLNGELVTDLVIPTTVTEINSYAFYGCSGLTSITIPDSVTSIGDSAFEYCSGLTSITIPSSVTSIGGSAFEYCSGFTTVNWNAINCTTAGSFTSPIFSGCTKLATVNIGDKVETIPSSAFHNCSKLASITIPNSVTSIGDSAFEYCYDLTSVTIGNGVTSIGEGAFFGCSKLVEVWNKSSLIITAGSTGNGYVGYYALNVYTEEGGSKLTTDENGFVIYDGTTLVGYVGTATKITIPNTIQTIYKYAFDGCSGLTSVTIDNSVTSIGSNAFYDCYKLVEVWNKSSLTITAGSTDNGYVGYYALNVYTEEGGSKLKTDENGFVIYDGTTLVSYVGNATNITIPNTIKTIYKYAFYNCSGLTSITIPSSVTSIGDSAFYGCSGLTTVNWNAINCTSAGSFTSPIFSGCTKLATVNIGDKVETIPSYAFYNCSGLTTVNWNATNCTSAGSFTSPIFSGCTKLTTVNIGNNVKAIPSYAFYNCSGSTSITVASGNSVYHSAGNCLIETASKTLLLGCKNSVIPDDGSVTSIGVRAFYDCDGLTSITIPDSVTSIGHEAFYECYGLTSVTIGNSVTSIGGSAFEYCRNLTSITISDSVTSIGEGAFRYCSGLTSITIPDSVTSIGSHAFYICRGLTSVTIGNGVTYIDNGAFSECSGLTTVNWNAINCTSAGSSSYPIFKDCTKLTTVNIGDKVETIPSYAFSGCSGLTSVTIPNSVTSIGERAFSGCSGLTSITVASGNSIYHSAGNCLIETETKTLVLGCKNSVIPNDGSVTSIGRYAFSGCSGLTSVTIPDSLTSIGYEAFDGCDKLVYNEYDNAYYLGNETNPHVVLMKAKNTSITSCKIHPNTKIIYPSAFSGCSGLTSITIPNSVTSIGERAFSGCSGLTSIKIPDSVTSIGDYAFEWCRNLTSITIPDSVTSIGSHAFYGCSGLTSITIPDSVTSIGDYAFYGCSGLTSVTIGNSVTSIGYGAFYKCSGLTSITIPDSVTSIGNNAFYGCSGLTSITFADTTTWYRTTSSTNWQNKTGGTSTSVTNASTNATYFKSTYLGCHWYKL